MRYARVAPLDELSEGGETAVMLADQRVLALSPLASEILRHLDSGPSDVAGVAAALVERFGTPPHNEDVDGVCAGLLDDLEQLGLVRRHGTGPRT